MSLKVWDTQERLTEAGWAADAKWTALGFSWRKRRLLKQWLQALSVGAPEEKRLEFVWGAPEFQQRSLGSTADSARIYVEDGLLRSVGLGADLVAPISWVFDTRGMYFDATQPSDLEVMLREGDWTETQLLRASALRERIVKLGIGKYNLQAQAWTRPTTKRRVVLVVGQVESDASIRLGANQVRTNTELLHAAREREADAYLVYKPHPDVEAGLRAGRLPDPVAAGLCDECMSGVAIEMVWPQIDALHVNTSLAGFEALLRGIPVITHGQPFYAGWGLTQDFGLSEEVRARRSEQLQLDALVYASLIAYPSYRNPHTGEIMSAEDAVTWLDGMRSQAVKPSRLMRAVLASAARWQRRY